MIIWLLPLTAMHSQNPIHSQGLTLIEALVVISILAILTAMALPSFKALQHKWQVQQAIHAMENALLQARTESIRLGGSVVLQKIANHTTCKNATTNAEWGCGWFLFQDANNSGTWTQTETKLQETALDGTVNVMHTSGGNSITFNRYGMAGGLNAKGMTFSPASDGVSSSATRTLCMATGGRIRITDNTSCTQ